MKFKATLRGEKQNENTNPDRREKAERPFASLWVLSALVLTVTHVIRGN